MDQISICIFFNVVSDALRSQQRPASIIFGLLLSSRKKKKKQQKKTRMKERSSAKHYKKSLINRAQGYSVALICPEIYH